MLEYAVECTNKDAIKTYTIFLAAPGVIPTHCREPRSAGGLHGIVVVQIDTFTFVGETVLTVRSSQILDDGFRIR